MEKVAVYTAREDIVGPEVYGSHVSIWHCNSSSKALNDYVVEYPKG